MTPNDSTFPVGSGGVKEMCGVELASAPTKKNEFSGSEVVTVK